MKVRIVSDDRTSPGGVDHDVFIERVSDGVVLGKYKQTEKVTIDGEEKTVSGREAARQTCTVNGWVIARHG